MSVLKHFYFTKTIDELSLEEKKDILENKMKYYSASLHWKSWKNWGRYLNS